jgi:hypothetical protein
VNGRLIPPAPLYHPRPIAQRDLGLWPTLHRGPRGLQRHQVIADGGNLLHEELAGRIVPAVNGGGCAAILDPGVGQGYIAARYIARRAGSRRLWACQLTAALWAF